MNKYEQDKIERERVATPEELREQAAARDRRAQESWERSDTDGFLSQWALGLEARRLRLQADVNEAGGRARFLGLYDGDRRLRAKVDHGQYGCYWRLDRDEELRYGRWNVPYNGLDRDGQPRGTSRVQKQLGLQERWEWAPARADIQSSGRGLSGTAWAQVVRTDDWGDGAEPVDPEEAK